MITTPRTFCPLCGDELSVMRTVAVTRCAEQVTYYAICGCGASHVTVRRKKIISVSPCEPEKYPTFRILAG